MTQRERRQQARLYPKGGLRGRVRGLAAVGAGVVLASSFTGVSSAADSVGQPPTHPRLADVNTVTVTSTPIVSGLASPTAVVSAPGTSRLFVAERRGTVRIVKGSRLKPRAYLDVRSRVSSSGGEQGLLGLAFPPTFRSKPVIYFTYTGRSGALVLARARATKAGRNRVDAKTIRTILRVPHPKYTNHNGGSLTFGPDGYLYLGTGDGGGGGDPFLTAQNLSELRGKILRLNVSRSCGRKRYCVPPSNPYASGKGARRIVWARGLRNPWRITTDAVTGDLWVADVGEHEQEEINVLPLGAGGRNLGWSCKEGNTTFNSGQCAGLGGFVMPVVTLCHTGLSGCAPDRASDTVIGGYVYRGAAYPGHQGVYLFSDFIDGNMYAYADGQFAKVGKLGLVTSFGQTNSRELVALTYRGTLHSLALGS